MALGKKGSRTITVDDVVYRWAVSPDSGYSVVIVQSENGDGEKLLVSINWMQERYSFSGDDGSLKITPGLVRMLIQKGIEAGWSPDKQGRDLSCDLMADETLMVRSN